MNAVKSLVKRLGLNRQGVEAARMLVERRALALAPQSRNRRGGRILCYHSVGQPAFGVNNVSPSRFRRQIELALALGHRFIPAAEIARTGGDDKDLAVTFDDALTSVMTVAAPILNAHQIPYSVFVVSEWSEHRHQWEQQNVLGWRDLERLRAEGVDLGSHSATHRDFGGLDAARAERELRDSRDTIEQRLGFAPDTLAIPFGQSANWRPDIDRIARDLGYKTIYAQAEDSRPRGTIPRTFVTRFDDQNIFQALLRGAYDRWEEWTWPH
jgi:peptidoglycan/xylan/chitin deacetylase (PgdA/CDA1 family)